MSRYTSVAACLTVIFLAVPIASHAGYVETNLVSDGFVPAANTDPDLKNPWGITTTGTGSPFWVSDNNPGLATLYNTTGVRQGLVVTIPPATTSHPTGVIFNSTAADFVLPGGGKSLFLFATLNGTIAGWNGGSGTTAQQVFTGPAAVYTGLTLANNVSGNSLYAANFSSGNIDVISTSFSQTSLAGSFTDPVLPAGFAPYGIQSLNGKIFVSYAAKNGSHAVGAGFVSVFDNNGNFLQQLITGGPLDAPWGMTIAPSTFGAFANDLLVGNFGNSKINAFDPTTGTFLGTLQDSTNTDLALSDAPNAVGLWGITFGNGGNGGDPNTLYFTSGINNEADGLLGSVTAAATATPLPSTAGAALVTLACLISAHFVRRLRLPA